jgi:hypothetical protein
MRGARDGDRPDPAREPLAARISALRRHADIAARSAASLVVQGRARFRYIEIQNIACDSIEYA